MSFPRYPKYKDSGVEWLGQVPEHWEVMTLRRCLLEHRQGYYSDAGYVDSGVKLLRITDLHDFGKIDFTQCPQVESREELEPFFLRDGDFVFARTGGAGTFGLVETVTEPVVYASYLIRFRFRTSDASGFLKHCFMSAGFKEGIKKNIHGGVNQNVHAEDIKNQHLAFPLIAEQISIATFLDHETAKIDALVAEQQRLIELLKEKRQSIISHAVTKGLNPNAAMKPSGTEWLGDVPAHWRVLQLNRLVQAGRRITYGIVQPGERDENGRFMIRGQDYSFGWAQPETIFKVSDAVEVPYKRARLMADDLVLTIVGAGVGNVAIVPQWLAGANITQTTARIAIDAAKADPRFVAAVLQGPIGKRSVELYAKGAAQPGLNLEHVRIFPVTAPPVVEQRDIATFIERETAKLDTLTSEAQRAIDLLQERRTALISAAVTGQIDVRALVQAEAA